MNKIIFILLVGIAIISCNKNMAGEDPVAVAKIFCDCIQAQLKNAPDSSVNLHECEMKVIANSRLMKIHVDFYNRNKYDAATLDSALNFSLKVREIEDSVCYDKIDFKKIKETKPITP